MTFCIWFLSLSHVFKTQASGSIYQYPISFNYKIIFHCMDKPCFIYSSLVGGFRVVSIFWLIYAILPLISMPKYLCGHVFISLGYIHLTVNSLGHMITLMFVRGTTRLVFTSLLPFHIPTSNDVEHLFKSLPVMPIFSWGEMAI